MLNENEIYLIRNSRNIYIIRCIYVISGGDEMKAILINDCLSCPMSDIDLRGKKKTGGNIKCTSSKGNNRIVGNLRKIADGSLEIPSWCPLEDLYDAIKFEKEMGRL